MEKKAANFDNSRTFHVIPLVWRQEEVEQICHYSSEAERKAALCELLEKETQMIASIGRHRSAARMERQDAAIQAFLDKVSEEIFNWNVF